MRVVLSISVPPDVAAQLHDGAAAAHESLSAYACRLVRAGLRSEREGPIRDLVARLRADLDELRVANGAGTPHPTTEPREGRSRDAH